MHFYKKGICAKFDGCILHNLLNTNLR